MHKNSWLRRQHKDPFVKQAKQAGYPSRAAYKLLELHQKNLIFKQGMCVVDLGAAPGGWSKVACDLLRPSGCVIALDMLDLQINDKRLKFIKGDINEDAIWQQLQTTVKQHDANGKVGLVMSDMAPNLSGQKVIDQPRILHLAELAWDCAQQLLAAEGVFLIKIFQGSGVDSFIAQLKSRFAKVKLCKPQASRASSAEFYIVARGFT